MVTINLTEKAAEAVKRIMAETFQSEAARAAASANGNGGGTATATATEAPPLTKLYLRLRVVGAGCSGYQGKLDLDPTVNEKVDEVFECHGVPVVVDKRSLLYLDGVKVDYHDELNRTGFSIHNPNAKSTCGCGSSWSM